jgi:hypothetical protein
VQFWSTVIKAAGRLGLTAWTACNISTGLDSPLDIELGNLAYDATRGDGAVILNTAFMQAEGKVSALLVGEPEAQRETESRLHEVLKTPYPEQKRVIHVAGDDITVITKSSDSLPSSEE